MARSRLAERLKTVTNPEDPELEKVVAEIPENSPEESKLMRVGQAAGTEGTKGKGYGVQTRLHLSLADRLKKRKYRPGGVKGFEQ